MVNIGLAVLLIIGFGLSGLSIFQLVRRLIEIAKGIKQEAWIVYATVGIWGLGLTILVFTFRTLATQ